MNTTTKTCTLLKIREDISYPSENGYTFKVSHKIVYPEIDPAMNSLGNTPFSAAEKKKEQGERRKAKRMASQASNFQNHRKSTKYNAELKEKRVSYWKDPETKKTAEKKKYALNPETKKNTSHNYLIFPESN